MRDQFLINIKRETNPGSLTYKKVKELPVNNIGEGIYISSSHELIEMDNPIRTTLIFGDIIRNKAVSELTGEEKDISFYFKNIKGTFYIIRINKIERTIEAASSIFGIFPVFFAESGSDLLVSSHFNMLAEVYGNRLTISKRFILEYMMFNYPLFDRTVYEKIRSIPANSGISIENGNIQVRKYFDIAELFDKKPIPYKNHLGELSDFLVSTVAEYFPEEPFFITFTGGFDGRTLVSCAKHHGCSFSTFSLGDKQNDDVYLPLEHASRIGIEHVPVYLDNQSYIDGFLENGKELLQLSGLRTNLSYTHFLFAARKISERSRYLLTGFGGSEIFRSLDIRGAVTSHELVDFFEFSESYQWKDKIRDSAKINFLDRTLFKDEMESLIEELADYQCIFDRSLGLSERIYIYLYEEVFRKVYGPVINAMSEHITIRNPYLDYAFNSELLKYSIAGVYSKFFVKNPVKRYKGQVLYGHVIKRTSPVLAKLVTGKGYRPADLTSYMGLANITFNFIRKRLARKITAENLDNLSLISSFEKNEQLFRELILSQSYFNKDVMENIVRDRSYRRNIMERDLLLYAFSIGLYLKMHHA